VTAAPDEVRVDCVDADGGWVCDVRVGTDAGATRHRVEVRRNDLDRLTAGEESPSRLVEASFGFLLEREPRTSILRNFALTAIGDYFPEYGDEIRRRLGSS
jgi:hypothetical protein